MNINVFCCAGSPVRGVRRICQNCVPIIRIGSTLMAIADPMIGSANGRVKRATVSGWERSCTHRKLELRSSAAV